MSEQIDWSKAPEGAMVLLKHVRDGAYAVSESYGDEAKTWHWPDPRYSFPLMPSMWRIVAERPATQSWSSEGLPPVGAVCEVRNAPGGWGKAVITHQGKGLTVWLWHSENPDQVEYAEIPDRLEFRPIRTPEQIAADEREEAVDEMHKLYMEGAKHSGGLYALYDAGYRKQ